MTFREWLFVFFFTHYPDIGQDIKLGYKPHVPRAVMDAYLSLGRVEVSGCEGLDCLQSVEQ